MSDIEDLISKLKESFGDLGQIQDQVVETINETKYDEMVEWYDDHNPLVIKSISMLACILIQPL